jgi:hypothetical protein
MGGGLYASALCQLCKEPAKLKSRCFRAFRSLGNPGPLGTIDRAVAGACAGRANAAADGIGRDPPRIGVGTAGEDQAGAGHQKTGKTGRKERSKHWHCFHSNNKLSFYIN